MRNHAGNMNEIWTLENVIDEGENGYEDFIYLTIEEGCKYQKEHPEKIISLWGYDPKEVADYIKGSGAKYIDEE